MSRSLIVIFSSALLALTACSSSSGPAPGSTSGARIPLENDGFSENGEATFADRFVSGEAAAAFFPSRPTKYAVREVRFLFGGKAVARPVTLTLYAVTDGGTTRTSIFSSDYVLTPSDSALQEISLPGQGVQMDSGEGLAIAIIFRHDGLPSVASDANGLTADRNWLYNGRAWRTSETFLIPGDWIIRAEIEEG